MSLLSFLFWIGFKLTGAILATCFWLFIEVPLAFVAFVIGLVLCCTLILIPVGIGCFKTGFKLLIPGI
ncbi:MAG: hypothetical protein IJ485_06400 [Lachnospiraceae bacterium]|nr:hypothetical protein [Lachnospiraceae bacterium]